MGIDLTEIDIVIISHGHKDHGGALSSFLNINTKAKIYIQRTAFDPHYVKILFAKIPVGLNQKLSESERFIWVDGFIRIDEELFIFSDVSGQFDTKSNRSLLKKTSKGYIKDDFFHEQNLIVTTQDRSFLFSGCSHRGIANILRSTYKHQPVIQAAFGGFHLYNPITRATEPLEIVQQLADELSEHDVIFYTCHCTGKKAFENLHNIMGDKLSYFSTGSMIEI